MDLPGYVEEGEKEEAWGDVSLGNVMVEFTLNSHNSPGAFIPVMLLVAGRVETACFLPTLGLMENP